MKSKKTIRDLLERACGSGGSCVAVPAYIYKREDPILTWMQFMSKLLYEAEQEDDLGKKEELLSDVRSLITRGPHNGIATYAIGDRKTLVSGLR